MTTPKPVADQAVEQFGYTPELKRTLGTFATFAVSFSFISVAVGVFGTWEILLKDAGPRGLWMWIPCVVGQGLVALIFAQLAARIPVSGSAYQWTSRLGGRTAGWALGWLTLCYLAIATAAVDFAMVTQTVVPLLGLSRSAATAQAITVGVLVVQAVVVVASTRIVAAINASAVGLEFVIVVGLTVALVIAVLVGHGGSVNNLTARGDVPSGGYFAFDGPLMLAAIMGLATIVGFDSAANLAEEVRDPVRAVPRAMILSVVAAGALGFMFLVALTLAIPPERIVAIQHDASPVAQVLHDRLGSGLEKGFLACITIAFFGAGAASMTSGARMAWSMARDRRFPASRLFSRVSPRTRTPIPATLLVVVTAIVLIVAVEQNALQTLIAAGAILPMLIYGTTVVAFLHGRRKLPRPEGVFDLGAWQVPVAVAAILWCLFALSILVLPSRFWDSLVIVGLLLAIGLVVFGGQLLAGRRASIAVPSPGAASPAPARSGGAPPG